MPLQKDTVSVPVNKGIQTETADRLVTPDYLLEAVNSRMSGKGAKKRLGHAAELVVEGRYPAGVTEIEVSAPIIRPFGAKTLPSNFLAGWGLINSTSTTEVTSYPRSEYPNAGVLLGGASRDEEILSWDGANLYSYVPGSPQQVRVNAALPAIRAKAAAKVATAQWYPDTADNGTRRVITWLDKDLGKIKYTVLDSTTESVVLRATSVTGTSAAGARVVALGEWFHIIYLDSSLGSLTMATFNQTEPSAVTLRSLGDCQFWDIWKQDENTLLVVRSNNGGAIAAWYRNTGQGHPSYSNNIPLATLVDATQVSVCQHPTLDEVAMVWQGGSHIYSSVYTTAGVPYDIGSVVIDLIDGETRSRVSVAPRYIPWFGTVNDHEGEWGWYDAYGSLTNDVRFRAFSRSFNPSGEFDNLQTAFHMGLASRAFRAGERTYCWMSLNSTLQSIWLLTDFSLRPVGRMDFSLAATPAPNDTDHSLASVNYTVGVQKDLLVFNQALGYRVRVPTDDDQVGLFTERSIRFIQLDFLPWLRSAQAGRCTYFAGAQLWSYDGAEVVEQGFHVAPEFTLAASDSGSLTALGTYSYRIDLCYPNAQGEEVRSHSLLVQKELTGSQGTITLSIKPAPTRREGAYLLIFRNAMESGDPSTTWNLLNSRDPEDPAFLENDTTIETLTFVDDGTAFSDTAIQSREAYPGNNSAYLYPFSSPGCELVCAGADRLWVAGGELPAGQVAPSRLFDPGEVPAFNANINRQVDRGDENVTALGFVGGVVIMFRLRSAYVLDGDGPDNYASGYWPPARLALADVGAVSQESLALVSQGLLFQAEPGIRMIGPGGALTPVGYGVDPSAKATNLVVRGAVVVPSEREVRWYAENSVLVYNYLSDCWSTWTLGSVGAVLNKTTGLGAVFSPLGALLLETEGLYTDAGSPYEHRIRFPWLHGGNLGDFQRLRRFAAFGEWDGTPHRVRVELFFDERTHWDEYWEWDVPDTSQNNDAWGDNSWGDGTWGDTQDATLHDSVWRFRRRPNRQKCSVFSIAISDLGSGGPGFTLTVLGLELAKKQGLDRIPWSGGTNSNRG